MVPVMVTRKHKGGTYQDVCPDPFGIAIGAEYIDSMDDADGSGEHGS